MSEIEPTTPPRSFDDLPAGHDGQRPMRAMAILAAVRRARGYLDLTLRDADMARALSDLIDLNLVSATTLDKPAGRYGVQLSNHKHAKFCLDDLPEADRIQAKGMLEVLRARSPEDDPVVFLPENLTLAQPIAHLDLCGFVTIEPVLEFGETAMLVELIEQKNLPPHGQNKRTQ